RLPPARTRGELRGHHGGPGRPRRRRAGPSAPAADPLDAARRPAPDAEGRPARRDRTRPEGGRPVNVLHFVVSFLGDGAHWQGYDGIPTRLAEHIRYSLLALALAAAVGLPAGLLTGHYGRGGTALALIATA